MGADLTQELKLKKKVTPRRMLKNMTRQKTSAYLTKRSPLKKRASISPQLVGRRQCCVRM